jgi:hypothetical protein
MRDFGGDLKLIRDLAVKREIDSGAPGSHWFSREHAELSKERGFPLLGLLTFALVLSTEWGVGKTITFAFWSCVVFFAVGVLTMAVWAFADFVICTPLLRKTVVYGFAGWMLFHLIKFHF